MVIRNATFRHFSKNNLNSPPHSWGTNTNFLGKVSNLYFIHLIFNHVTILQNVLIAYYVLGIVTLFIQLLLLFFF